MQKRVMVFVEECEFVEGRCRRCSLHHGRYLGDPCPSGSFEWVTLQSTNAKALARAAYSAASIKDPALFDEKQFEVVDS